MKKLEGKKMRYQIIDRAGATVATAQTIDDARYASNKYDAKHIYDTIQDKYLRVA